VDSVWDASHISIIVLKGRFSAVQHPETLKKCHGKKNKDCLLLHNFPKVTRCEQKWHLHSQSLTRRKEITKKQNKPEGQVSAATAAREWDNLREEKDDNKRRRRDEKVMIVIS
jgi:hypothetical protein